MTINLTKTIEIKANELKATKLMEEIHAKAMELMAVNSKVSKEIAILKEKLKEEMGDAEVLISKSGIELALWRQNASSIDVDKKLLQEKYPMAYNDCLVEKPGNLNFILK